MNIAQAQPEIYRAMRELNRTVEGAGLDPKLLELIKIRSSQLNHCAYCIDMHTKDARAIGETEQRLYALSAWHEAPFFTDRERAALALAEAVTVLTDGFVPDEVYAAAAEHFDEKELALVVWATTVINGWNRVAVATRMQPGEYVSHRTPA
ncbi:carboxymuconolactone decarboxylase family protein [Actinocatenispora rupis]|uniref:Alkyl hydroperoxide reductase AhpD n=2 Tax=Actinocatenispora rupis TaxID=519421 RepID=A0A8J3NDP7_9ACTN|nr:alkyl hydroperoxide reductase AhpD [Actinocatenispora rupis]